MDSALYYSWNDEEKWFVLKVGNWNILKIELVPCVNIQLYEDAVELKSFLGYFRSVKELGGGILFIAMAYSFLFEDYPVMRVKTDHDEASSRGHST